MYVILMSCGGDSINATTLESRRLKSDRTMMSPARGPCIQFLLNSSRSLRIATTIYSPLQIGRVCPSIGHTGVLRPKKHLHPNFFSKFVRSSEPLRPPCTTALPSRAEERSQ
jgi:hypothetical protein